MSQRGVFRRGRAGSNVVWHTRTNLSQHADKVRAMPNPKSNPQTVTGFFAHA
jgi:hypothetical protein